MTTDDDASQSRVKRVGAYAKLLANYASDDAIIAAGEPAELLFVRGLAFCATSDADGYVTDAQVTRIVGAGMRDSVKRARRLVEVGVWDRVDGGYVVRSWLKIHESAADKGRRRASDRERKAGKPKESDDDSARNPDGVQTERSAESLSLIQSSTEQSSTEQRTKSLSGDRNETLRSVSATNPPTCSKHPNGDHDGPCAGCAKVRTHRDKLEADHVREQAAAAANCPDCHGTNWREDERGNPTKKCDHRRTA